MAEYATAGGALQLPCTSGPAGRSAQPASGTPHFVWRSERRAQAWGAPGGCDAQMQVNWQHSQPGWALENTGQAQARAEARCRARGERPLSRPRTCALEVKQRAAVAPVDRHRQADGCAIVHGVARRHHAHLRQALRAQAQRQVLWAAGRAQAQRGLAWAQPSRTAGRAQAQPGLVASQGAPPSMMAVRTYCIHEAAAPCGPSNSCCLGTPPLPTCCLLKSTSICRTACSALAWMKAM